MIAGFYLGALTSFAAVAGIHIARGDVFAAIVHGLAVVVCARCFWVEVRDGR